MGISLADACFFNVRDSLLLESLLGGLKNGSLFVGYIPNQGVYDKNIKVTKKLVRILLALTYSHMLKTLSKQSLFTNQDKDWNSQKRRGSSEKRLLLTGIPAARVV